MLVVDLILLVAFGFLLAIGIRQAVDAHVVAAVIMIVGSCTGTDLGHDVTQRWVTS